MGKPFIDRTGKVYGRLTVLKRSRNDKFGKVKWLCRCECGKEVVVVGDNLRRGNTTSCGCYNKLMIRESFRKKREENLNVKGVQDLSGKKYGLFTVLSRSENDNGHAAWLCRCECGIEKVVIGSFLKKGHTKSCGCATGEMISQSKIKHGHSSKGKRTPTYATWIYMIQKCTNPNHKQYKDYGEKGVRISERWLDFNNFLEDMGKKPDGLSLKRINKAKGYFKENCIWMEQRKSTQTTNAPEMNQRMLTCYGVTKSQSEWEREWGVTHEQMEQYLSKLGQQGVTMEVIYATKVKLFLQKKR